MAEIDERTELLKRIERLRSRVRRMSQDEPDKIVTAGILLGLLDLLADEL